MLAFFIRRLKMLESPLCEPLDLPYKVGKSAFSGLSLTGRLFQEEADVAMERNFRFPVRAALAVGRFPRAKRYSLMQQINVRPR